MFAWIAAKVREFRRVRQVLREVKEYHTQSRAHPSRLVSFGGVPISPLPIDRPTTHSADCELAFRATSRDLMALAISRGCRHYAPLAADALVPPALLGLPHEVLACALMREPMPAGFDPFRCGVMVLSDTGNRPTAVAHAADYFGVGERIGYVTRLALAHDSEPNYWQRLLPFFPTAVSDETLPGLSRLTSETRVSGQNQGPRRTWLRTSYHP